MLTVLKVGARHKQSMRRMAATLSVVILAFWLGCSTHGTAAAPPKDTPPDGEYDVRGEVTEVIPASAAGPARLSIHHDAVPKFKDRNGKEVGMESMTMTFDLGPGVDVKALHAGDRITFHFQVRWHSGPMLLITKVTKDGK